jgi:hypothetical protein
VCKIDDQFLQIVCGATLLASWTALKEAKEGPPGIPGGLLDEAVAAMVAIREKLAKGVSGFSPG